LVWLFSSSLEDHQASRPYVLLREIAEAQRYKKRKYARCLEAWARNAA
jgi:hypothetical protein